MKNKKFKDRKPKETIDIIKKIINELGINIEEKWIPKSTVNTFSVRVNIKGTQYGTNGKGATREYALASAYGEFMERLQNKALGLPILSKKLTEDFYYVYDEMLIDAENIVDSSNAFWKNIFSQLNYNNLTRNEKIEKIDELLSSGIKKKNILVYPFYNYTEKKVEYLPLSIVASYYGTNGMCAGNTMQEALVQGFSEIFERHAQRRVIEERAVLPDIPENYIKKFEIVYKMYKKMKKLDNYEFFVKDASFGEGFPVVAIIIIEKNTGRYGMHFGAHPDFGIALERAFSEASQGRDILKFAKSSKFDFCNRNVDSEANFYNLYDIARGQYPHQLFSDIPSFEFIEYKDVSSSNNTKLLYDILNNLSEKGYTVYIRDVSFLGINAYHIIVPGLSDLINISERSIRVRNTVSYVERILKSPSKIKVEELKYVINTIQYFCVYQSYSSMQSFYARRDGFSYPFEKEGGDILFFLVLCYAKIKDYQKTVDYIEKLLKFESINSDDRNYLKLLDDYFNALKLGYTHDEAKMFLKKFYDLMLMKKIEPFRAEDWKISWFIPDDDTTLKQESIQEVVAKISKKEMTMQIKQHSLFDSKEGVTSIIL